jgi:glucose-1-phosphate thymidylyltransferase
MNAAGTTSSSQQFSKGILLAGGRGSRLGPLTRAANKQLLPIYDKPLVYYSLSSLMLAGVREVLLVTTPRDEASFRLLFGDGLRLGMTIYYAVQVEPRGIAEAFIVGREFVGGDPVVLALGDNLFLGGNLAGCLARAANHAQGATIFATEVDDPRPFGVVELDAAGRPTAIMEKPSEPTSNHVVPGLYLYDNAVLDIAAALKPSARGELEITDVNRRYLELGRLQVEQLEKDIRWLDTGTPAALAEATNLVRWLEAAHGAKLGCVEEIAFRRGWITAELLARQADEFGGEYGRYLRHVLETAIHPG